MDVHSAAHETETAADEAENVRLCQNTSKLQNLPARGTRQSADQLNGFENHADTSSMYADMHSVAMPTEMAGNAQQNIKMHQKKPRKREAHHIGRNRNTQAC